MKSPLIAVLLIITPQHLWKLHESAIGGSPSSMEVPRRLRRGHKKRKDLIAKSLEDKQESVDLDPSELPCLYESDFDIEEDHQEINSERRVKEGTTGHIRTYQKEGSWQVVVSKPALSKKREPQSFYDVLSFWKCKEKGQET
ncbi:hypothetical protein GBA52_021441 [Prunus armeniaca]|nr:hypothetical protein GBA52_021441 [Prunus armeniaca]